MLKGQISKYLGKATGAIHFPSDPFGAAPQTLIPAHSR